MLDGHSMLSLSNLSKTARARIKGWDSDIAKIVLYADDLIVMVWKRILASKQLVVSESHYPPKLTRQETNGTRRMLNTPVREA